MIISVTFGTISLDDLFQNKVFVDRDGQCLAQLQYTHGDNGWYHNAAPHAELVA